MPQVIHYPMLCHPFEAIFKPESGLVYDGRIENAYSLVARELPSMQYAWVTLKEAKISVCIGRVNLMELARIFLG